MSRIDNDRPSPASPHQVDASRGPHRSSKGRPTTVGEEADSRREQPEAEPEEDQVELSEEARRILDGDEPTRDGASPGAPHRGYPPHRRGPTPAPAADRVGSMAQLVAREAAARAALLLGHATDEGPRDAESPPDGESSG